MSRTEDAKPNSAPAPSAADATTRRRALAWALFPVVLLSVMVLGLGSMAAIAVNDPSFSVESDYYRKAIHWDAEQAQAAENARLGWKLRLEPLRLDAAGRGIDLIVHVEDASGAPVTHATLRVEGFPNARGAERSRRVLDERGAGVYAARLDGQRAGLWELRFEVQRGLDRFTQVSRPDVAGGST